MSEEEQTKPLVCDHFEPQAWRKTVCKNCFQPPDVHATGSGQNGVSDDSRTPEHDRSRSTSSEKLEKSATSSLKSKYEQLELDKYKPKDTPHTLPRTKKASGLALITEKYDELDRLAGKVESPTKGIPPPIAPKTYKKSTDGAGISKSKFGSVENVSSEDGVCDHTLGSKFKFGSMENISLGQDKKKDSASLPAQKSKFGGSVENITVSFKSKTAENDSKDGKHDLLNKLDMFQNEVKAGATSRAGKTVIHNQSDGHVNIINLPAKGQENDIKKIDQKKDSALNNKTQSESKFQKPELKSSSKDMKETGPFKINLKSKSELSSPSTDKGKDQDAKNAKDPLTSSKFNTGKLLENKSDSKKDSKPDFKLGLKSIQKDKDETKLTSVKDKLSKTDDKSASKSNQDLRFKKDLKGKEDSGKTELNRQDTSKSDGIGKVKLNFKDQLKSPESDNSSLSKYKDKMKSQTAELDKKQAPSWKDKLKSSAADNDKKETKLKDQLKSVTSENDKADRNKKPDLKLKVNLRSSEKDDTKTPENKFKDQLKSPTPDKSKNNLKSNLKSPTPDKDSDNKFKIQLKSPAADKQKEPEFKLKTQLKSPEPKSEEKTKSFDFRSDLKKSNDISNKDKEPQKPEIKNKFDLPSLKSNKFNSISNKEQDSKAKSGPTDLKSSEKLSNKFEPKFKLNKSDPKTLTTNEEKDKPGSKKFELPKLKSSKADQVQEEKPNLKSKFEPKSKLNDTTEPKNKFEIPSLKKKAEESEKADSKSADTSNETTEQKSKSEQEIKEKSDEIVSSSKDTEDDFHKSEDKEESRKLESKEKSDLETYTPNALDINKTNFDNVSSDTEAISGDACADEHTREKSPLHVDTQVFTSSRSKAAGVSCLNDNHFGSTDNASGFSNIDFTKSRSPPKDKHSEKVLLQNGDIASEDDDRPKEKEPLDIDSSVKDKNSTKEIEKLKAELSIMAERCQNLEKENEMLQTDLHKKWSSESTLKQQREDVENAIKGLRDQLASMEDKCTHLESENINLMNDLKAKHEINQAKPHTKETDEIDERLTSREKIMEDIIEENEQLKQEINELKVEMEEMYDSFRDQEAEEFREIQKELEYTAKNCRILQFKLRKMERKNDQVEQDKNQFEEKLRKLQNSFQDRDAVSHIRSLEDELRVSVNILLSFYFMTVSKIGFK